MAARWPPLIVGLKIESVHELGCLSSAQAKRIVSKTAKDRAYNKNALGNGGERLPVNVTSPGPSAAATHIRVWKQPVMAFST